VEDVGITVIIMMSSTPKVILRPLGGGQSQSKK